MNIVYKFTSSLSGKYYIGSKTECQVVDGKILTRDGKYYYSSCKNDEFWEEVRNDTLILTVLEKNITREELLKREEFWQLASGGVNHAGTYNRCLATQLDTCMSKEKQQEVINRLGQTLNEVAVHNSTVARKDAQAQRNGFDNYGAMCYEVLSLRKAEGLSYKDLDRRYDRNGYFARVLRGLDLSIFDKDLDILALKSLMREGITFIRACEELGIHEVSARYQVRGLYDTLTGQRHVLAEANGFLSKEELDTQILRLFLKGHSRPAISKMYEGVTVMYVGRALDRALLKHFSSVEI